MHGYKHKSMVRFRREIWIGHNVKTMPSSHNKKYLWLFLSPISHLHFTSIVFEGLIDFIISFYISRVCFHPKISSSDLFITTLAKKIEDGLNKYGWGKSMTSGFLSGGKKWKSCLQKSLTFFSTPSLEKTLFPSFFRPTLYMEIKMIHTVQFQN